MITEDFKDFDSIINSCEFIVSSEIKKRTVNKFLGIIEGVLYFEIGKLDILEVVKTIEDDLSKKKYKYNFRNLENEVFFRYDNVPHHKSISTFPHHKHIAGDIVESQEPDIQQILFEIEIILQEKEWKNHIILLVVSGFRRFATLTAQNHPKLSPQVGSLYNEEKHIFYFRYSPWGARPRKEFGARKAFG